MRARFHSICTACFGGLLVLAAGCDRPPQVPGAVEGLSELESPASPRSGEPNLFAGEDGRVHLTWFQELESGGHGLQYAVLGGNAEDGEAGPPVRTIVAGEDFFVNWADFPSLFAFPDGRLAAHWLVRSGPGPVDYDIHLAWSEDGGESWSDPVIPHRDGVQTEHGFVSLFPWEDGSLGAVWLDGRELVRAREEGRDRAAMTLHFTTITPDGLGPEVLLDDYVCDCCPTSAAVTEDGPIVVYRDRTPEEIRDISVIRHADGEWTEPRPVHHDGWEIPACPVNGPMVSARERDVAVAWFTGADDEPRVLLAFSDDAGREFQDPIRVDDGEPAGRVAVDLLPSGDALVSWLEQTAEGGAVRVRRVRADGSLGPSETVGVSTASRASGFPRMVRTGDRVWFAWTDATDAPVVRMASGRIPSP